MTVDAWVVKNASGETVAASWVRDGVDDYLDEHRGEQLSIQSVYLP